jgi:hypothetical protein
MREAVETGEAVIVERGGKPHVAVMAIDEYERLVEQQQREDWRELVAEARSRITADLGRRTLPPPERVLQQLREDRDEQLLAMC